MTKTFAEKRFFKWQEDDRSVSLRARSGSYGGGSEVLIVSYGLDSYNQSTYEEVSQTLKTNIGGDDVAKVIVLESNQNHAVAKETEVCPCLPASMGMGGGYVPMVVDTLIFDESQITSPYNGNVPKWNDSCHTLSKEAGRAIVIVEGGA